MIDVHWKVTYEGTTLLTNFQTISINRGRQQIQDPYRPGTAVITGRDLSTLPAVEIGGEILIEGGDQSTSVYWIMFGGRVSDIARNYGLIPAEDTWAIYVEDLLAVYGRSYTTSSYSWAAGTTTGAAAQAMTQNATDSVETVALFGSYSFTSLVSAQSLGNQNCLELLNKLAATEQGFLYSDDNKVTFVARSALGALPVNGLFTDGSLSVSGSPIPYDQVQFKSFADSYFDRVLIEPAGLTAQAKGTGIRTFTLQTFDESTQQAQNLADYVKATLDVQQAAPYSISCQLSAQTAYSVLSTADITNSFNRIELVLRGVKYNLVVLGCNITITTDNARFSFNVASSDALNFFILDDTTFGVLDESKLGF